MSDLMPGLRRLRAAIVARTLAEASRRESRTTDAAEAPEAIRPRDLPKSSTLRRLLTSGSQARLRFVNAREHEEPSDISRT
ncbi:hypothetical protein [Mangrovicella endophytica]|uniref:hypothetical protein n=1 Tax=Mangrovicella endophytica TaxID=2066697 RepID=UPI000C9DB432|nr:hypothetical protein [Mangrovicella endophytica]